MIPILYEQDEKKFTSNGIAILYDSESCVVTEGRNGKLEIELVYPVQGDWATDLIKYRYLLAQPNDYDEPHAFRIYDVQTDLAGNSITVKGASKTIEELSGNVVKPFFAAAASPQELWNEMTRYAIDRIPYTFYSDLGVRSDFEVSEITNVLSLLMGDESSMTSLYGGEVKRTNNKITLYRARGREHVTTIRPRKNLKNIKITTNMNGKYTRILPYAKYTPEGENQKEQIIYGDIVKSDLYEEYDLKRIVPIDISSKFNDYKQNQKSLRKTRLSEERAANKAEDANKRNMSESERLRRQEAIEEERLRFFEQKKSERLAAKQRRLEAVDNPSRGSRKTDKASRKQAIESSYATQEAKIDATEAKRKDKARAAAQKKLAARQERESIKAQRQARMAQIKEDTKIVITSTMVSQEAATYFDENPTVDKPNIKIEVDMLPLADTTKYERSILRSLSDIRLCDTVDVYVPKIDTDVTVKVIEIEYDVLAKRITKIVASSDGSSQSTLADSQRAEWKDFTKKAVDNYFTDVKGSINSILTSASGNNKNYYGPDEPPTDGLSENDLWFKEVAEGEVDLYRFDGTQWVLIMPHDFSEEINTKIESAMEETKTLLDQYSVDNEVLRSDIDNISKETTDLVKQYKTELLADIEAANQSILLAQVDLNNSKKYLSDKIVELRDSQLKLAAENLNKIKKDIQTFEDGILTKYSKLRIGTTNIFYDPTNMTNAYYDGWGRSTEKFHLNGKDLSVRSSANNVRYVWNNPPTEKDIICKPNTEYTISFYAKATAESKIGYIVHPSSIYETTILDESYNAGFPINSEWRRFYIKVKTKPNISNNNRLRLYLFKYIDNDPAVLYTAGWQCEESWVLSDWHPNDYEIEEELAEYKQTMTQNLARLESTFGDFNNQLTNVKSTINQTNSRIELATEQTKRLQSAFDTAKSTLDLVPGKIELAVRTAKEDALTQSKSYTNTEITASEGRIVNRITQNIPGTVENIISTSVIQESGKIRQAITSAMSNTLGTAKTYAQNVAVQEANSVRQTLTETIRTLPKKYGGRNYLSRTDVARKSGTYNITQAKPFDVVPGYNIINLQTPQKLGLASNENLTIQFKVKFAQNVTNARIVPELWDDTSYIGGISAYPDELDITQKNINGTGVNFRIGKFVMNNNIWTNATNVRFRVDIATSVEFEITECIMYSGDLRMDWIAASEDLLVDNSGQNLLRNGDFQYQLADNAKFSSTFWSFVPSGTSIITDGIDGFERFGKKGIVRVKGATNNWAWMSQYIVDNFEKGEYLTLSIDVARGDMDSWDRYKKFIRLEIFGYYNGGLTGLYRDFTRKDPEFIDMPSTGKAMRRIGATWKMTNDYNRILVKVSFPPSINVDLYITNIQLERSKYVNGFKNHPDDLDIKNNTKFQNVLSKVDLFSRTIGETENGIPTKIAKMVMDSESFQTTVTSRASAGTNLILDTETFEGAKTKFRTEMGYMSPIPGIYGKNSFDIRIDRNAESPKRWVGVSLPMAISTMNPGETYTIKFKYFIDSSKDIPSESSYGVEFKDHTRSKGKIIFYLGAVNKREGHEIKVGVLTEYTKTFTVTEKLTFDNTNMMPFFVWVDKVGKISISDIMLVRGSTVGDYIPATGMSSTIVKQLSNSYAIRVLDSASRLKTEINASPDGIRLKGKLIELDGDAVIHNGIIKNAMIQDGAINNAKIADATINNAKIINLDAGKIVGKNANLIDLNAVNGQIQYLFTRGINIGNSTLLTSTNGTLSVIGSPWRYEQTTDASIRTNGRFYGPTWFYGQSTTSRDYTPVMTNAWVNYPLSRPNNRPDMNIYAIRGLFLMTFSKAVNEYNTTAYLYVTDGSRENHAYYVPLYKNPGQADWHTGVYG